MDSNVSNARGFEAMELFVETLTGTHFQLRILPYQTVLSVKAQIQKLGGIPVVHQHLIWNNVELKDDRRIHDYRIEDGSTVRLILGMRGGPINARRVSTDDSGYEIFEIMDARQNENGERTTSNRPVAYLVCRGGQVNLYHVADGSDDFLGGAGDELIKGEEDDYDDLPDSSSPGFLDNIITMSKMKLLKLKMKTMNLSKKAKKLLLTPQPPGAPRSSAGYQAPTRRYRSIFPVLPEIGTYLDLSKEEMSAAGFTRPPLALPPPPTLAGQTSLEPDEEGLDDSSTLSEILSHPKVALPEMDGPEPLEDGLLPPLSAVASGGLPAASEGPQPEGGAAALMEESKLADFGEVVVLDDDHDPVTFNLLSQEVSRAEALDTVAEELPVASALPQAIESDSMRAWIPTSINVMALDVSPGMSATSNPGPRPGRLSTGAPWTDAASFVQPAECPGAAFTPHPRSGRRRAVRVESPDARPKVVFRNEPQDGAGASANRPQFPSLSPLPQSTGREGGHARRIRGYATIRVIPDDVLVSPSGRVLYATPSPRAPRCAFRADGTLTHLLPPVKVPLGARKKSPKHCYMCGRKTGLASTYLCRCGNNFCAMHRYAEVHDCSYDYKAAGRRFLQETNPIIMTPKLPKI